MTTERLESRHVSVWIDARPADVYAYVVDPRNLPHWAAGLASGEVTLVDGRWSVSSPLGESTVEFAPDNAFGILDHVVRLPDGREFYNPMRVVPEGEGGAGCEVVFTVRRRAGVGENEFDADVEAVAADLQRLGSIVG